MTTYLPFSGFFFFSIIFTVLSKSLSAALVLFGGPFDQIEQYLVRDRIGA